MALLIKSWANDLYDLIFPSVCIACGHRLQKNEHLICINCEINLPYTGYHNTINNPIAKTFWGRLPVVHATSLLFFQKGGNVQRLLHALKYGNNPEIGTLLGQLLAHQIFQNPLFATVEYIIPVPLHSARKARRGYNQSAVFAKGISMATNIPYSDELIIRHEYTETQTKKSRPERWQNVAGIFTITNPAILANKHLLLVDDVITTGATLEALGQSIINQVDNTKISIASIAYAAL